MEATLNWVDYTVIGIFGLSVLMGFAKGFVKEIVSLATLVAAFIIASTCANGLAVKFASAPSVQNVVAQASSSIGMDASAPVSYLSIGVAYAVLFIGTIIVGSIVSSILNLAFQVGILGLSNRLLGAAFGFVRGFILNLVMIFLVQLTSFSDQEAWQQSQLVAQFQPAVVWLGNIVSPNLATLKDKFGQTIQDMGSTIQDMTGKYQQSQ